LGQFLLSFRREKVALVSVLNSKFSFAHSNLRQSFVYRKGLRFSASTNFLQPDARQQKNRSRGVCQFRKRILLEPKPRDLREIKVKPLRSLEEIREEREALAMRETRIVTGIEVMQSPITALYQAFSRKERNKVWIAEQEYKDDQRRIVKELLQLYVSYDIISLNEDEFDDFIFFLNVSDEFLKTASDMELITFIKDKFEHFKDLPEK